MPHSLRVRLKNLQRKGELTERDIDRIFKALDQEPKTGRWIHNKCDKCGASRPPLFDNYCPNCGAKMQELEV